MDMLNGTSYVSAIIIVAMGCLVILCLLLYPLYFILNNVLYKRTQASVYFIKYIKHRKEFTKWYKRNKPNVYKPKARIMNIHIVLYEDCEDKDIDVLDVYTDEKKARERVSAERKLIQGSSSDKVRNECWYQTKKIFQ